MAVSCHLRRRLRAAHHPSVAPPDGLHSERRPRQCLGPGPASGRCHVQSHAGSRTRGRALFPSRTRQQERAHSVRSNRWRRRRLRSEQWAGLHQPRPVRGAQGVDEQRRSHCRPSLRCLPRPSRRPGFRACSGRNPRSWPGCRLFDAASKHERNEPRSNSQPCATGCSPSDLGSADWQQVRLSDLPDVASLKVNIDVPRLTALGLNTADVNSTLSTAWGGRYVNDFSIAGGSNASMSRAIAPIGRSRRI